jgi:hypothetical protein
MNQEIIYLVVIILETANLMGGYLSPVTHGQCPATITVGGGQPGHRRGPGRLLQVTQASEWSLVIGRPGAPGRARAG